jgi:hypothetical protein
MRIGIGLILIMGLCMLENQTMDFQPPGPRLLSARGSYSVLHSQGYPEKGLERVQRIERIRPALKEAQSFRSRPLMVGHIKDVYENLVRDLSSLQELKDILLDLDETRRLYREDQAIARIHAIGALGYLASQGELEPIESVIQKELEIFKSKNPVSKGELADLSDLLTEWIRAVGIDRIEQDLTLIVQYFPYEPKLNEAYLSALWNTLGWKTNSPSLAQQINTIFKGESSEDS